MVLSSEEARARRIKRSRAWYYANKERALAYAKEHHKRNRQRWMFTRREHRRKLRQQVLAKFENRCARCGFSDYRALQVDHVLGNGKEDRKQYSNGSTPAYLRKIIADTSNMYQLLCANCNIIKYWSAGETNPLLSESNNIQEKNEDQRDSG